MTRTLMLIMDMLPRDVAHIVEDYIWPVGPPSDEAFAAAGHYEMCMRISPDHGLRGACSSGHIEIARMMVAAGANLFYGLQGACAAGDVEIAEWLLNQGCLANASTFWSACLAAARDSNTPAETAAYRAVMRLLVRHGITSCHCGYPIGLGHGL